jgi:hypothetical protein
MVVISLLTVATFPKTVRFIRLSPVMSTKECRMFLSSHGGSPLSVPIKLDESLSGVHGVSLLHQAVIASTLSQKTLLVNEIVNTYIFLHLIER